MIRPEPGDETLVTPQTAEPSPWDAYAATTPGNGVPVTRAFDDRPTQAMPVAPAATVVTPVPQQVVVTPMPPEQVYVTPPDDRSSWVLIAAVVALLLGGLVGFLIGHSTGSTDESVSTADTLATTDTATADAADQRVNDIFTLLAAQARQPSGIQTPTPYPALDDLLGTLSAGTASTDAAVTSGSGDTSALTAERDQLQAQVTDLQNQLTETQSALAAAQQKVSAGGSSADMQAQLDNQAQQIATLQQNLDQASTDLQSVQSQLTTANKTLKDLDPKPVGNQVGTDIAKVRSTAKANGWTLIEQPIESATDTAGTVTSQSPAANTNMVRGSVLYVEVAAAPGSTG